MKGEWEWVRVPEVEVDSNDLLMDDALKAKARAVRAGEACQGCEHPRYWHESRVEFQGKCAVEVAGKPGTLCACQGFIERG